MDIVNWDNLQKLKLIRSAVESPDDLVLLAANTSYNKRGDQFQSYAIPVSLLIGGGSVYTADNGLTESPVGNFQLGGTLTNDVYIDGAGGTYMFGVLDANEFSASARYKASLAAATGGATTEFILNPTGNQTTWSYDDGAGGVNSIEMIGSKMYIRTPLYSTAANGSSLTLIDNTTGEVEFNVTGSNAVVLSVDQDISVNASYNSITNFQISVVSGKSYSFKAIILYTSPVGTVQSSWGYKSPTVPLFLFDKGIVSLDDGASSPTLKYCNVSTASPFTVGSASVNIVTIEGVLHKALADDVISIIVAFQDFATPLTPAVILAGSTFTYHEI